MKKHWIEKTVARCLSDILAKCFPFVWKLSSQVIRIQKSSSYEVKYLGLLRKLKCATNCRILWKNLFQEGYWLIQNKSRTNYPIEWSPEHHGFSLLDNLWRRARMIMVIFIYSFLVQLICCSHIILDVAFTSCVCVCVCVFLCSFGEFLPKGCESPSACCQEC